MAGSDYVCMPRRVLRQVLLAGGGSCERDRRVLHDPLYPPLGRGPAGQHDAVRMAVQHRQLYQPTRGTPGGDRFRLVAYLTNTQERGDVWKLFAYESAPGRHRFYISPARADMADVKLPIDVDTVLGNTIRDVYALPSEVRFNVTKAPFVQPATYRLTELPRNDWLLDWPYT